MTTTRHLETDARYVLLSPLAEGRRVLDLGCGDGTGLVQLVEAGADELVATSATPTEARAILAAAGIDGVDVFPEFRPPLSFDNDAFDLIICHDLPDRLAENDEWHRELRRLLAADGYLALAVAAGEGGQYLSEMAGLRGHSPMSYEEIYEKLATDFGDAAIFGQSPVVASLFFDFQSEEEDPGLTLDGSLFGDEGEDPGWYVLVFGPEPKGRDDLLFVRHDFNRAIKAVRGEARARPIPAVPSFTVGEVEALRRDLDLAEREATEAEELRELWGHAERTIQSQEQALRDERLRADRAVEASNAARLEVARLQASFDSTAGVQGQLSFARQAVAEQEETVRRFDDQKRALGDELIQRGEAITQLQTLLTHSQRLLAEEGDLARRASREAKTATEQLAIARLEVYRAKNDLQKANDTWARERKALEIAREEMFSEQAMIHTRVDEANERRHAAEREIGEQRDKIAELEKNLQAAEQMFERTKAELIKIEKGAEERIDENKAFTEALIQQSAMAAQAKLEEKIAALDEEKRRALEEAEARALAEIEEITTRGQTALEAARTEIREREQQLAAEHEQNLREAREEVEARLDEVRVAATERECGLSEEMESRLRQAREDASAELEAVKVAAEQHAQARCAEIAAEIEATSAARQSREIEEGLQRVRDEAESRVKEAEIRAQEAENRMAEAAGRVKEAEARAKETEARAKETEARVEEAEARVEEAEARAREAETRAARAEARVEEAAAADARIAEVEKRLPEVRAQLEAELAAANLRADTAEEGKILAEQDIMAYLQRLEAAEARAKQAQDVHEEAFERIKTEARQRIAAAKEKVLAANEARDALQTDLNALLNDLDEQRDLTQRLEGETLLKTQLVGAQERIEELEAHLRIITEERDVLVGEVESLARGAGHQETVPNFGGPVEDEEADDRTVIDGSVLALLENRDGNIEKKRKQDTLGRDIEPSVEELEDLPPGSRRGRQR